MTAYDDAKAALRSVMFTGGRGRLTPEVVADAVINLTDSMSDRYLSGLSDYNATTNVLTLAMSDGTTVDVSMTDLLADVSLTKSDIGLGNVDNTSDANKPVSTATQIALNLKANTSALGTAAALDVGTTANKILQLTSAGKLPAVDGSLLTNLPSGGGLAASNNLSDLTSAGTARSNLGLVIGTDVQAFVALYNEAANVLALRNGVNAQTSRVYRTYTDASNYERLVQTWNAGYGVWQITAEGAGTGQPRSLLISAGVGYNLYLGGSNAQQWMIAGTSHFVPMNSNASDIGDATHKIRSIYVGTDIKFPDGSTQATAPAAAAMVKLASGTVSAVATLDINLSSYTGYKKFVIMLDAVVPASASARMDMYLSANGGTTWLTASSYNYFGFSTSSTAYSGSPWESGNSTLCFLTFPNTEGNVSTTAGDGGYSGTITFENANLTAYPRISIDGRWAGPSYAAGSPATRNINLTYAASQTTNAFRFKFSTGNIASGTYAVYGIN